MIYFLMNKLSYILKHPKERKAEKKHKEDEIKKAKAQFAKSLYENEKANQRLRQLIDENHFTIKIKGAIER